MKKFIEVKSGKEVKLGDNVYIKFNVKTCLGTIEVNKITPITEDILAKLIKGNKVKVIDVEDNTKHANIWNAALLSLSKKTGWDVDKLDNILTTIDSVNPWAAAQIVLKEIAIELDKQYDNHINKSEKIYAISPQDGRIHEINKKTIKNYRAFPAFRSIEDAKIACSLVKDCLKSIFNA